jgi:hypothetical protein
MASTPGSPAWHQQQELQQHQHGIDTRISSMASTAGAAARTACNKNMAVATATVWQMHPQQYGSCIGNSTAAASAQEGRCCSNGMHVTCHHEFVSITLVIQLGFHNMIISQGPQ